MYDVTQSTAETVPVVANERGQASMLNLIANTGFMASLDRMANLMASGSATVPAHLQSKPADCFAVCLQAMQWGMNPFAVAQKTHLVNGTLGYEAQLVNAVIVSSSAVKGRFSYEYSGPWELVLGRRDWAKDGTLSRAKDCAVTVRATLQGGQIAEVKLSLIQVGTMNSPLWKDDPKQQLAYLAVKRWARLYAPDVILGVYTGDELEERRERELNPDAGRGAPMDAAQSIAARAAAKRQATKQEQRQPTPEPSDAVIVEVAAELEAPDEATTEQFADLMWKMDVCESRRELSALSKEVKALGERITPDQRRTANELFFRNRERLDTASAA
ncbi:MAG: RecT family recombinase [Aeromonas sp.]